MMVAFTELHDFRDSAYKIGGLSEMGLSTLHFDFVITRFCKHAKKKIRVAMRLEFVYIIQTPC